MKLNDFEHALKETGLYAQAGTEIRHDTEDCPLILGLPMTPNHAALYNQHGSSRRNMGSASN